MAVASTSTYRWVVLLLAVLSAIYLYSFYDGSGGGDGQHHVVSSMEEEEAEAYTNIIASAGTPSTTSDTPAPEETSDGSNTASEVEDVNTTTDAVDETSRSAGGAADSEGEIESNNDNIQDSTEEGEDLTSPTSDEPSTEETVEAGENEVVKQEEELTDSSPVETEASPQEEKYIFDPTEPFDIDKLLSSVEDGYDRFVEKLKKAYGGDLYYHLLFPDLEWDHDKNPVQMAGGEVSVKRLMRRLQIKLLAPHFYPKEKHNWVHDDKQGGGDSNTFLWINAGHSASAAHGNLFRQSYTAVMEQFASSVFQSAGLNFTARNYAMGGYEGGLELSLCLEQVYGQGFDMFSWDFGMIDGRHYFALMMMISRIMTMAHKWSLPAETEYDSSNDKFPSMSYMPFIHLNGVDAGRKSVLKKLATDAGVGGSFLNEMSMLDMLKRSVPDAETGDLTKQFELPPALKYFVCKGAVEGGSKDSLCSKHKYDSMSCNANEVKGRVGWHPGWKAHHFQGVTQAKWIVTALRDAVRELHVKFTGDGAGKVSEQESRRLLNTDLSNPSLRQRKMTSNKKETHQHQHRRITDPRPSDGATILAQLLMEEHADRMIYMTPPEDKASWLDVSDRWTNETVVENFNEATLSYSNSLCHVALLPAQARFDGIVLSGEKATSSPPLSMGDDLIMGISKRDFLRDTAAAYKQYFDEETDMHDQHAVEPDGSHERPHPLLLSWEEARTNRDAIGCTNETIKIDYKDFFLVPADVGWVSAIIPNSAELAAYQIPKELDDDSHKDIVEQTRANMLRRRGLIFICPRVCAFNKCPADAIKIPDDLKTSEEDDNGILQIEIDGVAVTGFQRHHGRSCWAMEHATTDALPNVLEWGVKDSYDMRFHIETTGDTNQKKKHLHISSLIVV